MSVPDGYVQLVGTYIDTRNGNIYSDVICRVEDVKYFVKVGD